ncbi:MAG TPA: pseudouridine synthase [Myxococcota bacterium]|nr:pseudouridine synthase [Myxococcota bacterium]
MSSPLPICPARTLVVSEQDAGRRLDAYLAAQLGLSRAAARRLLARGAVRVEGRPATVKGGALAAGSQVEVEAFTPEPFLRPEAEPELPLHVLAQGPGWLVVDKPSGVPVHALAPGEKGSLLSAVAARHPEIAGVGEGGLRSGVVHRLDVDTSGAVLFATEEAVFRRLRAAFASHRVQKRYRAIVLGELAGAGDFECGLVVARHRPARVRVVEAERAAVDRGVRRAKLAWRALEALGGATLVEVRLETGFLHQIRATFAHAGYPVAGDVVYGPREERTRIPRQMLHASLLSVDEISAASPDPADFVALLEALRSAPRTTEPS